MPAPFSEPAAARAFAHSVVDRLKAAGHEAFWAGGCVRDELLGRIPADYDVATSARPDQVRAVFGHRRTLAVGAAFGVITVVGPRAAGHVEVTTFRTDEAYTDGRHPAGVTFSSAREDAQRRDFTINGMFLDPVSGEVHDHVGGRADLAAGIVRAIGVPAMRFGEDHLRMLRAVRFAAAFGFVLEDETRLAIERMAHLVGNVSPERIAAELRGMATRPGRRRAFELLDETGLAREVLVELAPPATAPEAWRQSARVVEALDEPSLAMALAIFAEGREAVVLDRIVSRLRLSNREAKTAGWLLEAVADLGGADEAEFRRRPWSRIQPWIAHTDAYLLADVLRARADHGRGVPAAAAWLTRQTARPRDEIDPPPLVDGNDLLEAGVPAGRPIGEMLARLRGLQLNGRIATRQEALQWVRDGRPERPAG